MSNRSQYYVDPGGGSDVTGTGAIGAPWATVQYALDNITRDTTYGDQINVKAGTADTLSAALDFSTYGTPAYNAPCVIRGYTSTAEDGGVGDIDGNGNAYIFGSSIGDVHFVDMKLHGCTSGPFYNINADSIGIIRCEVYGTTGNAGGAITLDNNVSILFCYLHDNNGHAIDLDANGFVYGCYIDHQPTTTSRYGINLQSTNRGMAYGNIIVCPNGDVAINAYAYGTSIVANSMLGAAGSYGAVYASYADANNDGIWLADNLIEGWTSQFGIYTAGPEKIIGAAGNACYNNGTNYSGTEAYSTFYDDNESLGASPFAKSGALTYANRRAYFNPVDTGNVWAGAFSNHGARDKGAVQHLDSSSDRLDKGAVEYTYDAAPTTSLLYWIKGNKHGNKNFQLVGGKQ